MIVPELLGCLQIIIEELPEVLEDATLWLEKNLQISALLQGEYSLFQGSETDWQQNFVKIVNVLLNGLGGMMGVASGIISSVFSTVVTLLVGVVFSIYLLIGKEKLWRAVFRNCLQNICQKKVIKKVFIMLLIF